MATTAVDFVEYRDVLDEVLERIKRRVREVGVPDLDDPEAVFNAVADSFDAYREAYLYGVGVDEALLELTVTTILLKGQG